MMKDAKLLALYEMLDSRGVKVEFTDDVPVNEDGYFDPDTRIVWLRASLTERPYRATLAHETAHVIYDDVESIIPSVNRKQERRADEWAAIFLIERDEYRAAEAQHDGNAEAIALALNVTTDLVEVFQGLLLRIGDLVYVGPRMGAGQWIERLEQSGAEAAFAQRIEAIA